MTTYRHDGSSYQHRWLMVCDDERESYASRAAALDAARWHRRHPGNADIRTHGPYANVDGIPRVIDLASEGN